ncbi:MAG: DUF5706 domain-containing protein [Dehalococcoidales bacterium]|nr:DUF5706 domain-containing protein [Dehalococcoidales bacterium]
MGWMEKLPWMGIGTCLVQGLRFIHRRGRLEANSEGSPKSEVEMRMEASYKNIERVVGWIGNADNKALIVLAFQGAIIAGGAAAIGLLKPAMAWQPTQVQGILFSLLLGGFAVAFILSVYNSVRAPNPDVTPREQEEGQGSPFFFGSIAAMSLDDFRARMHRLDVAGIEDELIRQTHVNAGIASRKFGRLRLAIVNLGLELAFLVAAAGLLAVWLAHWTGQ